MCRLEQARKFLGLLVKCLWKKLMKYVPKNPMAAPDAIRNNPIKNWMRVSFELGSMCLYQHTDLLETLARF